ncbi:MAG: FAD-dependent monooxygenase [Microgenomates group bacterium]|nr:FAD-dependent monooxygenase [Microgenomates group bacterium]
MIEGQPIPERVLPSSTEVVIVGAGLSGLFLACCLADCGINFVIIDSKIEPDFKNAYYLLSLPIAKSWGINWPSGSQNTITGATIFDPTGNPIQVVPPNPEVEGFSPVSQLVLEKFLKTKLIRSKQQPPYYQTCFRGAKETDKGIVVNTSLGLINAELVIDATGWPGVVFHSQYPPEDFLMTGLWGSNYQTPNIDPRILYFIFGLPETNTNWAMPIGENKSQILAGQYGPISSIEQWWGKNAEQALQTIIGIYKLAGFKIEAINEQTPRRMGFRQQPAARRYFRGRIIPFGEAAGLNNPLHGQLIDGLPYYGKKLAEIIKEAKESNRWDSVGEKFFQFFIQFPPFIYFLHMVLRQNQVRSSEQGQAKPSTIIKLASQNFGDQVIGLLQANGFSPDQIRILITHHPFEIISWFFQSVPSFIFVAARCPFLLLQLIDGLRRSYRR